MLHDCHGQDETYEGEEQRAAWGFLAKGSAEARICSAGTHTARNTTAAPCALWLRARAADAGLYSLSWHTSGEQLAASGNTGEDAWARWPGPWRG